MIILSAEISLSAQQLEVSTDYLSRTTFSGHQKNHLGKGEMVGYGLKYIQPLSMTVNDYGQPTTWTLSFNGVLYNLKNIGEAQSVNPDRIINTSINISHIRPLSTKWSIVASIGCGIYSNPRRIGWESVLANGGCVFIYRVNEKFSVGGGVGLTNAYGAPMVAPMVYLKWTLKGRMELDFDITNGIKARAATWFGKRFKLAWNVLEWHGCHRPNLVKWDGELIERR